MIPAISLHQKIADANAAAAKEALESTDEWKKAEAERKEVEAQEALAAKEKEEMEAMINDCALRDKLETFAKIQKVALKLIQEALHRLQTDNLKYIESWREKIATMKNEKKGAKKRSNNNLLLHQQHIVEKKVKARAQKREEKQIVKRAQVQEEKDVLAARVKQKREESGKNARQDTALRAAASYNTTSVVTKRRQKELEQLQREENMKIKVDISSGKALLTALQKDLCIHQEKLIAAPKRSSERTQLQQECEALNVSSAIAAQKHKVWQQYWNDRPPNWPEASKEVLQLVKVCYQRRQDAKAEEERLNSHSPLRQSPLPPDHPLHPSNRRKGRRARN